MFQHMKIGKRLRMAFGLMLVSFIAIVGITILTGIQQQGHYKELIDVEINANELAIHCRNNTNRSARNLREMFLMDDRIERADMYQRFLDTKATALEEVEELLQMDPLGDGSIPKYADAEKAWASEAEKVAAKLQ